MFKLGFYKIPEFAEMIKLTTEKLMLRNIPKLDLSASKTSEWINLEEIDLKGNSFISFFLFNKKTELFLKMLYRMN